MTLYQFLKLDKIKQEKILNNESVFIDIREEKGLKQFLYQVHSFYVELFYDQGLDRVTHCRCFSETPLNLTYEDKLKRPSLLHP